MANATCGKNNSNTIGVLLRGNANARLALISPQYTLPLQHCILHEDLVAAKVLLDFDPTLINAQCFDDERLVPIGMASWTALHVAAYKDYELGIIFLLNHNADARIKNSGGRLAIDMVKDKTSKAGILLSEAQARLMSEVIQPNGSPPMEVDPENRITSSWCRIC